MVSGHTRAVKEQDAVARENYEKKTKHEADMKQLLEECAEDIVEREALIKKGGTKNGKKA